MQIEKSNAAHALRALVASCEAGGWVCTSLEIGAPQAAFRLELRQGNHMYVATIDYERRCVVEQFAGLASEIGSARPALEASGIDTSNVKGVE